ncbi:GNAT family N-acetyltransferase [Pseudomonas moraviensis]|uniref:GNAT family N-acetyltransferase n=1 Tax=Pseudomonas moraviensis TaxID=321662 RepID=UPI0020932745|nr:GNAT family N-acetyltransferase [Pseudomonas moraviensis]UST64022.1 GNAT family N-acetyltransferase [Pseudomonas moraviensis]UVL46080.1 GNAT family N-acetyltransferase [Pseudomonas moraviensis]
MSWNLYKDVPLVTSINCIERSDAHEIPSSIRLIDSDFLLRNPDTYAITLPAIIRHLKDLSGFYPEFNTWLYQKTIPGIIAGERSIILEHRRGTLSGLAIVKNSEFEQKLCCLRVLPEFQGSGVGLRLFERAFELLNNDRPLLSVAEEQIPVFQKLFSYYGFELEKKYNGYYRPLKDELSFNGLIEAEPIELRSPRYTNSVNILT